MARLQRASIGCLMLLAAAPAVPAGAQPARLVAVGEESGSLREFLERSAELCEERAERTLERLVTFIEPAMIVAFGVLIAFVALSLLQAIYGVDATTFR